MPQPAPPPAHRADPTREGAFDLLAAVLGHGRTLEEALAALPQGEPRDRSAAHRLAAAVLRRAGSLDAGLEPFLRRAPPDPVRHILRIGAAQLLLLDTPAHAAVATGVALARARGLAPFTGLVNAVLRRVAAAGAVALEDVDAPRLDTPGWLWTSWGADARAIATAHQTEAPLDLTLRAPGLQEGEALLEGEALPTGSLRLPAGTRVTDLPGYADGAFWVQDAAATLPARLLAASPGEHVLDLCAAPGGKTAQLAATGASVTALDRDAARLVRLHENLARLALAAEVVQADALAWRPPALVDAVLLDAPCSATGTIRRHPDIPHLRRQRDVEELAVQQAALIRSAASMLRPGGRLVYAVCSLQLEEGAGQCAAALACGLAPAPFTAMELAALPEALTPDGCVRTHPGLWPERGGMDGFFIARFTRR